MAGDAKARGFACEHCVHTEHATPACRDNKGRSPLDDAVQHGHVNIQVTAH